jgi:hypothetical protein
MQRMGRYKDGLLSLAPLLPSVVAMIIVPLVVPYTWIIELSKNIPHDQSLYVGLLIVSFLGVATSGFWVGFKWRLLIVAGGAALLWVKLGPQDYGMQEVANNAHALVLSLGYFIGGLASIPFRGRVVR